MPKMFLLGEGRKGGGGEGDGEVGLYFRIEDARRSV